MANTRGGCELGLGYSVHGDPGHDHGREAEATPGVAQAVAELAEARRLAKTEQCGPAIKRLPALGAEAN